MNATGTQEVNKTVKKHDHAAHLKRWAASIQEAFLNRANIGLLAAGILYGVFRPFFEQLFSRYWVAPFLTCFQSGVLTQIVAWAAIIGIVVKCGITCRNREQISEIQLYRWILITAIWAVIRFSGAWSFFPWVGCVTYFDIVPFYALSIGIAYGCQFIKRKPSAVIEEEGFECDEPIETSEEDLLGRSEFAQTLARKLLKTQSAHQSFAVGILSPWGYGKTSFLNLIKDELKRYETIYIDFSPWIYGKDTDLIREFFTEMGKQLRQYADTLPRDMREYAQILEKNESTSWLSMLLSLGSPGYSLEQQSNLLKQSLEKIDRPIVVFIDDLDRLGSNEVMEVLKLIRNAANFSKIKFVVAYDRPYLVEAIKKQNIESANCYLEKIFQIEYTLPAFERKKLIEYLKAECGKFVRAEERKVLEGIAEAYGSIGGIAIEELKTLRDVKRYINSLQNSYKKLAGNVVLHDLMNLEILQLKYKPVYDLLSQRWEQVLIENGRVLKLYEGEEKAKKLSTYRRMPLYDIKSLLQSIGYTELEINHIIHILKFLFPPTEYSAAYGTINHKATTARYFYNTIQDKDLPIDTFKGLWQQNYETIKKEVDNILNRNQAFSFVNQLDSLKPNSVEICKKATRIAFYVGSSKSRFKSSYHTILSKIDLLNTHYSNEEITAFLLLIIEENGLSDYLSDFLFSEFHSLEKYLSYEEIMRIETDYLQEAIHQDLPLGKVYNYMLRANYKENDYIRNERANSLFKSYVNKHIEEFLQSVVEYTTYNGYYSVSPSVINIWGSWINFKDYVMSISPRTPIIDEFESFLDTFIGYGAEKSIRYIFKYITINK